MCVAGEGQEMAIVMPEVSDLAALEEGVAPALPGPTAEAEPTEGAV